jgi:magnesium chelatase subunit D
LTTPPRPAAAGTALSGRLPASDLDGAAVHLRRGLPWGVRLGETAVASTHVHLLNPADPDAAWVLVDRDAGQVFYGRPVAGEIVHLDVFHALADVDCHAVAGAVSAACAAFGALRPGTAVRADLVDLQTATGGGRATGRLQAGRVASLCRAHRSHVHLAARCLPADAAFCFLLVDAVEAAVAAQGVELRQIERVLLRFGGRHGEPEDLSPYSAATDTLLRAPESGSDAGAGEEAEAARRRWPAAADGQDDLLMVAVGLADRFGGPEAVRALLDCLDRPRALRDVQVAGWTAPQVRDAVMRLAHEGWAEAAGTVWGLTPAGRAVAEVYRRRLREVELALRMAARRVAVSAARSLPPPGPASLPGRRGRGRGAVALAPGERVGELAAAETVIAALCRRGPRPGQPLRLAACDLRVRRRLRPRRVDVLLLLDASASMEGNRMRAAKTLARHLLLTSRDRVAVMAFQERGALVAVPFTRNYMAAERGLARVMPAGLTPLAAGLAAAREYLAGSHAKNPLLLLVTDGIPTVSTSGGSPLEEALAEAQRLGASGAALACIGLEPNERYLAELVRRAGGTLHVVSELRADVLAEVARRERQRRLGTAPL